jgi:predicted transcriptional regulator
MGAMSTKDSVRALLDRLPDDCSLEDVLYHLYVVQQVELGLAEADAGNVIPHEQVVQELERRGILGAE